MKKSILCQSFLCFRLSFDKQASKSQVSAHYKKCKNLLNMKKYTGIEVDNNNFMKALMSRSSKLTKISTSK